MSTSFIGPLNQVRNLRSRQISLAKAAVFEPVDRSAMRNCQTGKRRWPTLVGEFGRAIHAADYEAARIEQVLRLEIAGRPAAAGLEFDTQEIADLAINAIAHLAEQLAFGVADAYIGLKRNGLVELETGARERNVFKVRDTPTDAAGLVLPVHVHHVRAKQPSFNTPIEHILLIGVVWGSHYALNWVKITYQGLILEYHCRPRAILTNSYPHSRRSVSN